MALRRAVAKNKSIKGRASRLICHYQRKKDIEGKGDRINEPNGPIAHLMESMENMGGHLNGDFTFQMENECDINILNCPVQHIKPLFINIKSNDRTKKQMNTRRETINLKEIDKHATCAIMGSLTPQDGNMLRVIQSGSMWNKSKLAHTGEIESNECDFCNGGHEQTTEHVLWHCEAFKDCRHNASKVASSLPSHAIPKPLLYGIAPAMMADPSKSYWGSKVGHLDWRIQEIIGLDNKPTHDTGTCHLFKVLHQGEVSEKMNARQFFQHLRGSATTCDTKHMVTDYIFDLAPAIPNVYTDGAMGCPKNQNWSLMGVGLWWPCRTYATQPLSPLENMFVENDEEKIDGVRFWGCMKGHRGSSTRAEIAAIVIALLSKVPVHIATDSANAKKGLEELIMYLKQSENQKDNEWHYEEWPMGKHWSLINDGDLWHQVWTLLVQRGPYSVAVAKVKGHAKEIDVKGNEDLELRKEGNDKADQAADEGRNAHGEGMEGLAKYLERRHDNYTKLVRQIQIMILAVIKESAAIRELEEKKKKHSMKKAKRKRW